MAEGTPHAGASDWLAAEEAGAGSNLGVYLLIAASQWDRHNTQKQIDAAYTIAKKLLDARPVR